MTAYAICGGRLTGKSVLAQALAERYRFPIVETAAFDALPWNEIPDAVIQKLSGMSDWILEGTQAARVLRRMLNGPKGPAASTMGLAGVYILSKPLRELTEAQLSSNKGIATVFESVRPLLNKAGVPIFPGLPQL